MTYETFVQDPLTGNSLIVVLGCIAAMGGLFSALATLVYAPKWRTKVIAAVTGLTLVTGMGFFVVYANDSSNNVREHNRETAENNLKKKYDIEEVLWGKYNTYPESYDLTDIYVQDKNSNILKYQYKINPETKEPYLLNDSDSTSVKANDLILNK